MTIAIHYTDATGRCYCKGQPANPHAPETDRAAVTCKRCLASLAKRDREFQRKARGFLSPAASVARIDAGYDLGRTDWRYGLWDDIPWAGRFDAARAIAREEGRAL